MIQVGTPGQPFRIIPSTSGNEIWVPLPQGCDPSILNCGDRRGVNPFNGGPSNGLQTNASTTRTPNGIFDLIGEKKLNYTGNGQYGFDTIGLGPDVAALQLANQVVAGIATEDFYLGELGLGPKPSNFTTNLTDPVPSFLRTMVDKAFIPSLSFGYTAGAKYRQKSVFGSLTLGGYDASRFAPNNLTFTFGPDDSRSLLVGVQAITADNTLAGTVATLSSGILTFIDSGTPHVWLPLSACTVFERAFGLVYDPHTDLYLVNSGIHAQLTQLNPSVTFTLGNEVSGGENVNITLPYGAFDLQASQPIYANATSYFPLRRAANESQYTLGRTFLQETYITVDYGRSKFSVQQAMFQDPMPTEKIKAISNGTTNRAIGHAVPYHQPSRLNIGTILGIVFPIVTISVLIITLIIGQRRRDRKIKELEKEREMGLLKQRPSDNSEATDRKDGSAGSDAKAPAWIKSELPNDTVQPVQQLASKEIPLGMRDVGYNGEQELNGSSATREIDGRIVYEMSGGDEWVREMDGVGQRRP